jgi:hypothetical protein
MPSAGSRKPGTTRSAPKIKAMLVSLRRNGVVTA